MHILFPLNITANFLDKHCIAVLSEPPVSALISLSAHYPHQKWLTMGFSLAKGTDIFFSCV